MSLASLIAEIHEQQKWQVCAEVWGHLYPKPGDHDGVMVVAHSDYGDQGVVVVVHQKFEFRGVLRVWPSGKACFVGKWTKMNLYPGRIPATKPRGHWGVWPYTGKKAMPEMRESDDDYYRRNRSAVVRFLDTMNRRRLGRDGMEPTEKTAGRASARRVQEVHQHGGEG